jgi:hypothetical protein
VSDVTAWIVAVDSLMSLLKRAAVLAARIRSWRHRRGRQAAEAALGHDAQKGPIPAVSWAAVATLAITGLIVYSALKSIE